MMRIIKWIAIVVLLVVLLGFGLWQISKSRTFQFFGVLVNRVETSEKVVALTFDDAPNGHIDEVLEILDEKDVKATFYVIGESAEENMDVLRSIIANGHEVGNHSYSHQRFLLKSWSFVEKEIETTNEILREAGYSGDITFRPPTGKKLFVLPWYLQEHNIITVMWDVEPDTYFSGDAEGIKNYTLDHTVPGSIILIHPFCEVACKADRESLPTIIDELKAEGYSFVTVSDLLENG